MKIITDIDDDRISYYKSLRYTPKLHSDNNAFIAEGEKVVLKLISSGLEVISVFATHEICEKYSAIIEGLQLGGDDLLIADIALMRKIVGYNVHSGFMAIGRKPADTLPLAMTPPLIVLNNLANSENVGSIVRNAAAFGFKSIIADETTPSPWLRRAVRVSMGSVFGIKIYHSIDILNTIIELKENGFKIISAEITEYSVSAESYNPANEKFVIVFGSEGRGISHPILEMSDAVLHIPISRDIESLNVASSSAVLLNRFSLLGK